MQYNLMERIKEYQGNKKAIGHFNMSNLEGFHAIIESAKTLNMPVIIGISEGEEDCVGIDEAVALRDVARKNGVEVYLNADHHYSFERVASCIDAGFDMVIFDGAKLSIEDAIVQTKKCVEYAREKNPQCLVESELGYIGQSSKIYDELPVDVIEANMTTVADATRFVTETGLHLLAPAVGNVHGIIASGEPPLHDERVRAIAEATKIPLVLHGASGNTDSDIRACIDAGVAIVHVNTELRVAYTTALRTYLAENPKESAPYKYTKPARDAMQAVVAEKIKLFAML